MGIILKNILRRFLLSAVHLLYNVDIVIMLHSSESSGRFLFNFFKEITSFCAFRFIVMSWNLHYMFCFVFTWLYVVKKLLKE